MIARALSSTRRESPSLARRTSRVPLGSKSQTRPRAASKPPTRDLAAVVTTWSTSLLCERSGGRIRRLEEPADPKMTLELYAVREVANGRDEVRRAVG